jgi:peroxiredoxin
MTSLDLGTMLGLLAAALLAAMGIRWLQLMTQVRVPARRTAYHAGSAATVVLGAAAFAVGSGTVGGVAAALAILGGVAFLALSAASGQARTVPAVAVGGTILEFTAPDDAGRPFALASLRGRPFLLKFFRGHWCPYCTAELRRWEELRAEIDARNVAIVTVCADTPEQIRAGRAKHGLGAVMLADPELVVTDRYRLRNPRGFALKSGVIVPLPIPTTILVDAAGIVRWIDQATDYMVRSEPARVLHALRLLDQPAAPVQFRPAAVSR